MTLSTSELAHVLLALGLLLTAAHGGGYVFARLRLPRVIGEIAGGVALGPTLLGSVAPGLHHGLFPERGPTAVTLAVVYQLGLLLLMFCSGAEIRSNSERAERRSVLLISGAGTLLPFVAGLAFMGVFDLSGFHGPADSPIAFLLVFAIATAVTSIPVIARIMFDLGILRTVFARIVLAAAVVEDVVLYVVLATALGLVQSRHGDSSGLAGALGIAPASVAATIYHVVVTLVFFGLALWLGPKLFGRASASRYNLLRRSNQVAFHLVVMLAAVVVSTLLGVVAMFGAFVAGIAAVSPRPGAVRAREEIKSFSFAFFIPVYFALVGLRLDLVRDLDPLFFVAFFTFACAAKALSVYVGARWAGELRASALNFAVAMNARGGPGIVLASVAYDAGIVDRRFYAALVLLAVVTSVMAGWWLQRVVRSGRPLRPEPPPEGGPGADLRERETTSPVPVA